MNDAPVLIMAGGTGGHVFPALAVAHELIARGRNVVWLGTPRGIENRLIPAANIDLDHVRVAGLRHKGLLSWVLAPFKLLYMESAYNIGLLVCMCLYMYMLNPQQRRSPAVRKMDFT